MKASALAAFPPTMNNKSVLEKFGIVDLRFAPPIIVAINRQQLAPIKFIEAITKIRSFPFSVRKRRDTFETLHRAAAMTVNKMPPKRRLSEKKSNSWLWIRQNHLMSPFRRLVVGSEL